MDNLNNRFKVNTYYKSTTEERVGATAECIEVNIDFIKMKFLLNGKEIVVKYNLEKYDMINCFYELTELEKELM